MARPLGEGERGQVLRLARDAKVMADGLRWVAANWPAIGGTRRMASALNHIDSARMQLMELLVEGVSETRRTR